MAFVGNRITGTPQASPRPDVSVPTTSCAEAIEPERSLWSRRSRGSCGRALPHECCAARRGTRSGRVLPMRANPTTNGVHPGVLELPSDLKDIIVSFLTVRAMARLPIIARTMRDEQPLQLLRAAQRCGIEGQFLKAGLDVLRRQELEQNESARLAQAARDRNLVMLFDAARRHNVAARFVEAFLDALRRVIRERRVFCETWTTGTEEWWVGASSGDANVELVEDVRGDPCLRMRSAVLSHGFSCKWRLAVRRITICMSFPNGAMPDTSEALGLISIAGLGFGAEDRGPCLRVMGSQEQPRLSWHMRRSRTAPVTSDAHLELGPITTGERYCVTVLFDAADGGLRGTSVSISTIGNDDQRHNSVYDDGIERSYVYAV